eukprot:Blabericola_migrator_1__12358@NODE_774_length_6567_cov_442_935846_g550_i0_p1_GENE_NODE_774_length_6567_cov_442_935846_g550_i0NODE_774_length_6567_cov_442_935846_g550_i0_p1_ORF_typecomplete_len431_score43_20DUF3387/PF11867_8/0_13_NODE_774_length_6567_cov_442_935846_g550_i013282620
MTRFLKVNSGFQLGVSVRDVITAGLVWASGSDSRTEEGRSSSHQFVEPITFYRPDGPFASTQSSSDEKMVQQRAAQGPSTTGPFQERYLDIESDAIITKLRKGKLLSRVRPALDDAIYPSNSRSWIAGYETCMYGIPNFFQIKPDTPPARVLEILEQRIGCLVFSALTEMRDHCASLFRAIEATLERPAVKRDKVLRKKLLPRIEEIVLNFCKGSRCYTAADVASANSSLAWEIQEARRKMNEIKLSEEQYDILWFLEPAVSFLSFTTDNSRQGCSKSHSTTPSLSTLIRTSLLRHHVLTRLSGIKAMTDNKAAQYCRSLLGSSSHYAKGTLEPGPSRCLHRLVRRASRQEIAERLLEALEITRFRASLNLCFIVAVDLLGCGHSKCPLDWKDILPLFDEDISVSEYEAWVRHLALKLRPWLNKLVASRL